MAELERTSNPDEVICPSCNHQFGAIPENVQRRLSECAVVRKELERERLRLSACGVAAMTNTPETSAKRIGPDNPYYSASYADVCAAVDREMALREERDVYREYYEATAPFPLNAEHVSTDQYRRFMSAEHAVKALRARKGDGK